MDLARLRQQILAKAWRTGWKLPDRRPMYEFAADELTLPGTFTISGKFSIDSTRHWIAPMDALHNDLVRYVILIAPPRSGKTMIADIWIPDAMVNDPGPMMFNLLTEPMAKEHAEIRTMPVLMSSARVRELLPADRNKIRQQEIIFAHGNPLYIQGSAMSGLQNKGIRYQINDEIHEWEPGRLAEALARTLDFERIGSSKVLIISQAGLEDDDLDVWWKRGSMREWMIECQSCSKFMPSIFSGSRPDGTQWGMRWADDERSRERSGDWNLAAVVPTIRYECQHCGHPHLDSELTRSRWNKTGKYEATNLKAHITIESFRIESVIMNPWEKLVCDFLEAQNAKRRGVLDPLRIWVQKSTSTGWAAKYANRGQSISTYEITEEKWAAEYVRILTADFQEEGVFWVVIRAWAKSGESRRLWFGKCFSEDEVDAKAEEFQVKANRVLLDSGHEAKLIYAMCVKHGWLALKGDDAQFFVHREKIKNAKGKVVVASIPRSYAPLGHGDPESGKVYQGRRFANLIRWSNPTIKDRLKRQRDSGFWLEPVADESDEMEKEYREQMAGEWRKAVKCPRTGRINYVWFSNKKNHAFDCSCMQLVAATLLRILPDMVKEEPDPKVETPALAAAA